MQESLLQRKREHRASKRVVKRKHELDRYRAKATFEKKNENWRPPAPSGSLASDRYVDRNKKRAAAQAVKTDG